ncbi:MAG: hypothetical protein WCI76_01675 [bacterium]
MMPKTPTILIIFGASGDLAHRHLLPALEQLKNKNLLPDKFELVGVSRKEYGNEYEKLNDNLLKIEERFGVATQRIFYLAVPTKACPAIVELIGGSNLKTSQTKILLEKPFGFNLKSATELVAHVNKYFTEDEVYRVDHYMLKEGTQEMLTSRRENPLFKDKWNKNFIESVEIISSEAIGIEGRVDFYEQTGALVDFLQNHLLEMAGLTLMELPKNSRDIPAARLKALKNLNIVCDITKSECVKRAQYESYREEVNNPQSMTETFVSVNLRSSDPRWTGVPIILTTGKALKEKFTKINIHLKDKSVYNLFGKNSNSYEKVLLNAINSDRTFFSGSEEILETWRILDEIQQTWKNNHDDLIIYKKGISVEEV